MIQASGSKCHILIAVDLAACVDDLPATADIERVGRRDYAIGIVHVRAEQAKTIIGEQLTALIVQRAAGNG